MGKVKVYKDGSELIGVVNYNEHLDYYVGTNCQNGGFGYHKGITKLKNGEFVIIEGSDYQGHESQAYVVTDKQALIEIIGSGNLELLELKKFKKLKDLYEKTMLIEDESEDE